MRTAAVRTVKALRGVPAVDGAALPGGALFYEYIFEQRKGGKPNGAGKEEKCE